MNLKTVKILAYITAPVTFAAIVWPSASGSISAPNHNEVLLPGIKAGFGDVAKLIVESGTAKVTLTRAQKEAKPEAGWVLADKSGYPVQAATLRPVLDDLRALRGVEPKTERSNLYSRLGLEDVGPDTASHKVTLENAAGTVIAAVILGRTKTGDSVGGTEREYVRLPDQPRTWLAEPAITVPDGPLAWIDHGIIDVAAEQVKRVVITQANGDKLDLARAKPADKLTVQNMPAGAKLKSDSATADVAGGLAALELDDVKPASAMTVKPDATAHYETFGGMSVDIPVYKLNGQSWITVAATGGADAAKIAARTKGWAYLVPDTHAASLVKKTSDVVDVPAPIKDKPAEAKTDLGKAVAPK